MAHWKNQACLLITGMLLFIFGTAVVSPASEVTAFHHICIELFPDGRKLDGRDDMAIEPHGAGILNFRLAKQAEQVRVFVDKKPRNFSFQNGRLRLSLTSAERSGRIAVSVHYTARFDDKVPEQPINTEDPGFGVAATISRQGSFLLPVAGWYPELDGVRTIYRLTVTAPHGMVAVTAGRSLGRKTTHGKTVSEWEVTYPVEGLSLSVAPYVVEEKPVAQEVTASTYLLPSSKDLAATYLDATARYLRLYSDLFGPYPFQKFAVVENFFPTGFGFPSYTLLGGSVLRLPFIVHTSLGHEIAHCWWGNGVYVDAAEGNWSEGLTTYVADYRFKELASPEAARDYRRQWLRDYAALVSPSDDFALSRFQSRYNPVTRTIGYDKGAMVFHMLRRSLGEEAFWGALRDVYRNRLFKRTSWSDLQHAFENRAGRSLQHFFDQWIYRPGAPDFVLDNVQTEQTGSGWKVRGRIVQQAPFYSFALDLALDTGDGRIGKQIEVSGKTTPFQLALDHSRRPQKLTADPDNQVFRRLAPSEIPPAVNTLKSSPSVITVLAQSLRPETAKAAQTLALSLGVAHNTVIIEDGLTSRMLAENDILLIGRPHRQDLLPILSDTVTIGPNSFSFDGKLYDHPADAFFGVFTHPAAPGRVAALFLPLSSQYADRVARKIGHYGKYSYLVFNGEKNAAKGIWPVTSSPLVYRWNPAAN